MRSFWRTIPAEVWADATPVCLAVALIGISYGATAVTDGFPVWVPPVLGVLVLAGGAEFTFVGLLAAGAGPAAAVAAGLLVNTRHLPYGLALPDVLGRGRRRWLGVHVMNDESVVLALGRPGSGQRAAYWVCGLGVLLCWPGGAAVGAGLGTVVPDPAALGLDAVFPAVLAALVWPALGERPSLVAALAGAAVALAAVSWVPSGLPVLLALCGVGVGETVRRWAPGRPAPESPEPGR